MKMKRTGNYTLDIGCDKGYKITHIEWCKIPNGSSGDTLLYTFEIRTKSVHGDYYNKHICANRFTLTNNQTGKSLTFKANPARPT